MFSYARRTCAEGSVAHVEWLVVTVSGVFFLWFRRESALRIIDENGGVLAGK